MSRNIEQVIQIVVHQFVCKTSAQKKFISLKKIDPPLSPGTHEYVKSVLRSEKQSPINPMYVKNM